MRLWLSLLIAFLSCASITSLSPNKTSAANLTPIINLEQDISLQKDGKLRVETQIVHDSPEALNWELLTNANNIELLRDGTTTNSYSQKKTNRGVVITSQGLAQRWTVRYQSSANLIRHNDRDQIFIKIFQLTEQTIESSSIRLSLPSNAQKILALNGNVYAIGSVSQPHVSVKGSIVTYNVSNSRGDAIVSVSASWNKDSFPLSRYEMLKLWLINLETTPWLLSGLLLPIISLLILAKIYLQQKRSIFSSKKITSKPPQDLRPMIVGVLVNKKIFSAELTATLIDLCARGYLVVVYKGGQYLLGKRKEFDDHLSPWERKIVERIFIDDDKIEEDNLQQIGQRSLYSPKIRAAFSEVYQTVTDLGFFTENPHLTRIRYKLYALFLYFLSVCGIIWVVTTNASALFLIPLVASLLSAQLIIKLSIRLTNYSKEGRAARQAWLSFANFLKAKEQLVLTSALDQTFELYLPYAIALGCEKDWAERFELTNHAPMRPDWFISYGDSSTRQFARDITNFGNSISKIVSSLRGPLVN